MEPADEKWIEARFEEISNDLKEIKEDRRTNIQNFRTRLNLLERQIAIIETEAKVWGTIFGCVGGIVFAIITEMIIRNIS